MSVLWGVEGRGGAVQLTNSKEVNTIMFLIHLRTNSPPCEVTTSLHKCIYTCIPPRDAILHTTFESFLTQLPISN